MAKTQPEIALESIGLHGTFEALHGNFEYFLETHFEVAAYIALQRQKDDTSNTIINHVGESVGTGGLYELALEWTNEFQKEHALEVWGETADWFDTIEAWLEKKNTNI